MEPAQGSLTAGMMNPMPGRQRCVCVLSASRACRGISHSHLSFRTTTDLPQLGSPPVSEFCWIAEGSPAGRINTR